MRRYSEELRIINEAIDNAPVDLKGLANSLGVEVRHVYLDDDISGMIEHKNERYVISVNALDACYRQRFTIAHELGHFMNHRHLMQDGIDDNRAYRSTSSGRYHNTEIGPAEETQANRFAAALLMPAKAVRRAYNEGLKDVNELARKFQVSKQAMRIRLESLGLA